jgi:hypothetical protein
VTDIQNAVVALDGANSAHNKLFVPMFFCHGGYDAVYVEYLVNNNGSRPLVVLRCTITQRLDYKLQYAALLVERLFPNGNNLFLAPRVYYYVVTTKTNVRKFDMNSGVDEGFADIQNYDPTFPNDHFEIVYYHKDINYTKLRMHEYEQQNE